MISTAGTVLVNESYSAYGYRRSSSWAGPLSANSGDYSTIASTTRRGYTDAFHEILDNVGLIHMNGRVYDPVLGRFLSADGVVAQVGNSQSGNPYSYVQNRPLTLTDPTGMTLSNPKPGMACIDNCKGPRRFLPGQVLSNLYGGMMSFGASDVGSGYGASAGGSLEGREGTNAGDAQFAGEITAMQAVDAFSQSIGAFLAAGQATIDAALAGVDAGLQAVADQAMGTDLTGTWCVGPSTTRGVGGDQATADGALFSLFPDISGGSIQGGTFGTVAVQKEFLGLTTREFRIYGEQIFVSFSDQARSARFGGPVGSLGAGAASCHCQALVRRPHRFGKWYWNGNGAQRHGQSEILPR